MSDIRPTRCPHPKPIYPSDYVNNFAVLMRVDRGTYGYTFLSKRQMYGLIQKQNN